jgi:TonB family protein
MLASRIDDGFARMVSISLGVHIVVLIVIALAPSGWGGARRRSSTTPMVITLGGTPGPRAGGMTMISGRPVQQVVPLPTPTKSSPVTPPAAKAPEMVLPDTKARAKPAARTPAKTPDEAKGRKPSTGQEVRAGSAVAETGGQGIGFGLTTGGGQGTGGYLDVGNFCCPEYLETMRMLITRNWRSQQRAQGAVQVKFTIQRSGELTDVELEKRSGYFVLDTEAQRAILLTKQLPPLPAAFTEDHLTVHLIFQYIP